MKVNIWRNTRYDVHANDDFKYCGAITVSHNYTKQWALDFLNLPYIKTESDYEKGIPWSSDYIMIDNMPPHSFALAVDGNTRYVFCDDGLSRTFTDESVYWAWVVDNHISGKYTAMSLLQLSEIFPDE